MDRQPSPPREMLVLVAEDDTDVRELVAFRLEHAGYSVVTASDGREAVEAALERSPDVCLIDVMMPVLDGYGVTERLRRTEGFALTPILLLTAGVEEAAVRRGFEAGATDYIKKPFSSRGAARADRGGARIALAGLRSRPMSETRKIRVVVAKPGLDGHDRGAKIIARALRDAGMEVIYTGLHQTPDQIAATVIQEDADAVGLSILSGAHMTLVPRVVTLLADQGVTDVVITVGGTIPADDVPELKKLGVAEVFTPGSPTDEIVEFIRGAVAQRA